MYALIDGVQLEHHDDVQGSGSCCLLQPWEDGCGSGSSRLEQHMCGCYQKGFAAGQCSVLSNLEKAASQKLPSWPSRSIPISRRDSCSFGYICFIRPTQRSGLLGPTCGEEGGSMFTVSKILFVFWHC